MIDLAKLKALAEAATPGPWSNDDGKRGVKKSIWTHHAEAVERDDPTKPSRYGPERTYIANALAPLPSPSKGTQAHANASFIAACDPTTVLTLIAEIDRLTALVPVEMQPAGEPDGWGWYVPDVVRLIDGFPTRQAAIEDAIRNGAVGFYVGAMRALRLTHHVNADDVREMIEERVADNLSLDDFHVAYGPQKEADHALDQWVLRYLEPDGPTYCEGAEVSADEITAVRAAMTEVPHAG